jgi:hypothetical protein
MLADHASSKRKATARVYPRRKAGETVRSTNKAIVLTREMLEPFFGTPLRNAAWHMGLCPTALKSVCRKLGIHRWPYQQSRRPGACYEDAGIGEPDGEEEMSSSSSISGAATVEAESPTSRSPCEGLLEEHAAVALPINCADAQSFDSGSTVLDSTEPCESVLGFDHGDRGQRASAGPGENAPFSLLSPMEKPQEDKATSSVDAKAGLYIANAAQFLLAGGRSMREHFNPHAHPDMYPYMGAYPFLPHCLPSQRSSLMDLPYGHGHQMPAARGACAPHARARAHAGTGGAQGPGSLPTRRAGFVRQKLSKSREDASADKSVRTLAEPTEGVEAEVELSRAAQRLEPDEWSFLAQQMAAHQTKREKTAYDGWANDNASVCDMAWLSPCS